jgi:hypothetical protein
MQIVGRLAYISSEDSSWMSGTEPNYNILLAVVTTLHRFSPDRTYEKKFNILLKVYMSLIVIGPFLGR